MAYTDTQIDSIIQETLAKFQNQPVRAHGAWLCDTAEEAIASAKAAQKELIKLPLEKRGRLIEAMRKAALKHAEPLARLANEETGYGRIADKKAKNILAAEKTPGIEDLHAQALHGRLWTYLGRGRALWRDRLDHALHQPDLDGHQQRNQHDRRG